MVGCRSVDSHKCPLLPSQQIRIHDGQAMRIRTNGSDECCVHGFKVAGVPRGGEGVLDTKEGTVRDVVAEMRLHGGGMGGILREQCKVPTQCGGTDGLGGVDAERKSGSDWSDTA